MLGIKRGLFSNEVGVVASDSVFHPVRQGLVQILRY